MAEDDENNHLSEEDIALWEYVTQDDKKLPGKKIIEPTAEQEENPAQKITPAQITTQKENTELFHNPKAENSESEKKYKYLELNDASEVDGRTTEKLRRGRIAIEASLDLHGLKQDEAFESIEKFILRSYQANKRCLLLITGKGAAPASGILRENTPNWLNTPRIRPKILIYCSAQPQHGGSGAFYIYLRKNRQSFIKP